MTYQKTRIETLNSNIKSFFKNIEYCAIVRDNRAFDMLRISHLYFWKIIRYLSSVGEQELTKNHRSGSVWIRFILPQDPDKNYMDPHFTSLRYVGEGMVRRVLWGQGGPSCPWTRLPGPCTEHVKEKNNFSVIFGDF